MIWFLVKYYASRVWYKITFREHPIEKARKQDPFIYEE
jgi:hypothetical protein